ncbi:bifunctional 5,10-methylenetetrahydrofolate dehydrogenase/5,10-methenyltetrahydrofolate cyclohydrolase [Candidatus Kaiserbacteria bacterium]|nr:MAG: bifunctional 5,10-methylenetetrahydrofolate dehydrogenase/5,10-methenyltetrahydrofolate cyclohydrolase [Candidatus Kaiserbacteria bacterium]
MIVDGRKIAEAVFAKIRTDVSLLSRAPRLVVISCAPTPETERYLALKQKKAAEVGIITEVLRFDATATTEEIVAASREAEKHADGIIMQLPLPATIDTPRVLAAISPAFDVDALNPETTTFLSPVVGAIHEILVTHGITATKKNVTIIGSGKLVGLPAHAWFSAQEAQMSIVTKDTVDIGFYTRVADIIVCGAGVPGLLTPDMVKEGVIILDAGTSEEGESCVGMLTPLVQIKQHSLHRSLGALGLSLLPYSLEMCWIAATKRQSVV